MKIATLLTAAIVSLATVGGGLAAYVAVTKYQTDMLGSEVNYKFTQDDERFALSTLLHEERLYEDKANMFNDSNDVQEVWSR